MTPGWPRITFDSVPSTMDVAASLAARGAVEGTVVIARHQSAGRGRSNRQWTTPPGTALLCSVVLRPEVSLADLMPMAILTGDAIACAIRQLTGLDAIVKWPNDVLIGGRKASGVLIQTRQAGGRLAMIVGFGINTGVPPEALPPGATSLLAEGAPVPAHGALLDAVMEGLGARYQDLYEGRIQAHLKRIGSRLAMAGELVTVWDGEREVVGRVAGIDEGGALLLVDGGTLRRIVAGDVVRGPRRRDAGRG